jgi:hypothetical protein
MSFDQQTRWCWLWGLAMVPVLVIMGGGAAVISHNLVHMLEILSYLIMFEMAIFIGIGGVLRPASKMLYHAVFERVALFRWMAALPPLRLWFWLTPEGRRRNA